jgi:hypothetical protein
VIYWPSGETQVVRDPAVDKINVVTEPKR